MNNPFDGPVHTEIRGKVLVITINRPAVRNAVNSAVATGIASALDRLDADSSLSVGVLTGAEGTFCAGMDLKAFLEGERPSVEGRGFAGIAEKSAEKPLIAAVEGYALAGGFEIALACDLIVASRTAKLGVPEVKRGLIAAGGALLRLPSRIPYHHAMELVLTGDLITGEAAADMGLINRLTAEGEALDAAVSLATRIAGGAPLALAGAKKVIVQSADWPSDEAFKRQAEIYEPIRSSRDAREGALAFAEKRDPVWRAD